jgi:hypothetical protein
MGTRQPNSLVSTVVASCPLTLVMGLPGARSAKPCARDPPSPVPRELLALTAGLRTCHGEPVKGRPPSTQGQKGRGDGLTSPLPNAGLAKASPTNS